MPSGWDGRRVQLGTLRSVRHLEATKKRRSAEGEEERVLGGWSSAQQVGYLAKEHQARVRGRQRSSHVGVCVGSSHVGVCVGSSLW